MSYAPKKVVLTKLGSTNDVRSDRPLRTEDVTGVYYGNSPEVGVSVRVIADPIDQGMDFRFVVTSPVTEVLEVGEHGWKFRTKNSVYRLAVLSPERA